ncbi:MAG TPA: tRNA pseudouridine(55) synthase TruB [Longimicrobiales bacterium]|nr:tRNA pseudouridine(55) synthase TruB [Longimicrobiales bacterium]
MTSPELDGILPVDKPIGPTSHDVVAAARRALRQRRVGHTGTLDPFASGLLLLCLGRATRITEYLGSLPKSYTAVIRFGIATDTDDPTGTTTATSERWRDLADTEVATALERQQGLRLQRPPAFSAKKQAGQRLYERARRGEAVLPKPVEVMIHSIRLLAWDPPLASFETTCASGTYIRAIARDAGDDLGVPAHLAELRRTAIGSWHVSRALGMGDLGPERAAAALTPSLAALSHLPSAELDAVALEHVRHGRAVDVALPDSPAAALGQAGLLVAIARVEHGRAHPRKVFSDA